MKGQCSYFLRIKLLHQSNHDKALKLKLSSGNMKSLDESGMAIILKLKEINTAQFQKVMLLLMKMIAPSIWALVAIKMVTSLKGIKKLSRIS